PRHPLVRVDVDLRLPSQQLLHHMRGHTESRALGHEHIPSDHLSSLDRLGGMNAAAGFLEHLLLERARTALLAVTQRSLDVTHVLYHGFEFVRFDGKW